MDARAKATIVLILVLSALVPGCGRGQLAEPTHAPTATSRPAVTSALMSTARPPATSTPTSTSTPTPTSTATPTPAPTPEVISLGQVGSRTKEVQGVAFSPDGKTLAIAALGDEMAHLWDMKTGQQLPRFPDEPSYYFHGHVLSIAFSPKEMAYVLGTSSGYVVVVIAGEGAFSVRDIRAHGDNGVSCVAFSPDGKMIASGSWDKTAKLIDLQSGNIIRTLSGHEGWVNSVAFAPDGKTVATGSQDGAVRLWNVQTGKIVREQSEFITGVRAVAFSPDGKLLAAGGWIPGKTEGAVTTLVGGGVRLWDVATGTVLADLVGHAGEVTSVSFSPDGRILASGSEDTTVILWDVGRKEMLDQLTGHTGKIVSVAFSPDGMLLASGATDGKVIVWFVGQR